MINFHDLPPQEFGFAVADIQTRYLHMYVVNIYIYEFNHGFGRYQLYVYIRFIIWNIKCIKSYDDFVVI